MGGSLPALIGARIGRPDAPCLGICGDGGLLMALGEYCTLLEVGGPCVLVVINDVGLGSSNASRSTNMVPGLQPASGRPTSRRSLGIQRPRPGRKRPAGTGRSAPGGVLDFSPDSCNISKSY